MKIWNGILISMAIIFATFQLGSILENLPFPTMDLRCTEESPCEELEEKTAVKVIESEEQLK